MASQTVNADPVELGERLKFARIAAGFSQESAANHIGVVRTTMVAIEKGTRRLKPDELVRLSKAYSVSCNELLRPSPIKLDLVPQFRMVVSGHDLQDAAMEAAHLLQRLCTSYVEVERTLNRPLQYRRLEKFTMVRGVAIEEQAEDYAASIRVSSGLGGTPIPDMIQLLEEWGFRLFVRPLDSRISGVYAHHNEAGPCILLNGKHPPIRNNSTAAHELGHECTGQNTPAIVWTEDKPGRRHDERIAWSIGKAFLMPRSALRQAYAEVQEPDGSFTVNGLIYLAHRYHVSVEAIARRLEELDLVKQGTAMLVANRGVVSLPDLDGSSRKDYPLLPARLAYLLSLCEEQALLSEGQMSSMFMIERSDLRGLLDQYARPNSE
jgi:Zn-dependent peptidase ImmA (M78 family)/DNA-binding XRE family transcriptional regulator